MGIIFRDRTLKPSGISHYHCTDCGQNIHPYFSQSHKYNPDVKALYEKW